jgi:hypothetical protein
MISIALRKILRRRSQQKPTDFWSVPAAVRAALDQLDEREAERALIGSGHLVPPLWIKEARDIMDDVPPPGMPIAIPPLRIIRRDEPGPDAED